MTEGRVLSPVQSAYYANLIADGFSPTLMAAVYEAVTDDDIPRCAWWTRRHKWKQGAERGTCQPQTVTGRSFSCGRCRVAFSVGSLGYRRWSV